jgi:hypothetical protein
MNLTNLFHIFMTIIWFSMNFGSLEKFRKALLMEQDQHVKIWNPQEPRSKIPLKRMISSWFVKSQGAYLQNALNQPMVVWLHLRGYTWHRAEDLDQHDGAGTVRGLPWQREQEGGEGG